MRPEHLAFYKRIDEILWNGWESFGTAAVSELGDDHYGCLPRVYRMAVGGASSSDIANYLEKIERERIRVPGNARKYADIADTIVQEKKAFGL